MIEAIIIAILSIVVCVYQVWLMGMQDIIDDLKAERSRLLSEQRQWLESDERYAEGFAKIR